MNTSELKQTLVARACSYELAQAIADEIDRLRVENARLQAWHDAVMGQERHSLAAVPYAYSPGFVPPEHAMTIKTVELIIRPQPLAKE